MPITNRPQKLKKIEFSKLKNLENLHISFEDKQITAIFGTNGSGKSTQLAILRDWLKSLKQDVIFTEWNSSDLISQTTKLAKKKN